MSIQDSIKAAKMTSNSSFGFKQYMPKQYSNLNKRYYNEATRTYVEEMAQYASDFVDAEVQGLIPEEPMEYVSCHLRFSDVVRASASIAYQFDNYKNVLVAEKQYEYLRRGAKIQCMGNTWLIINPDNMSNVYARGLIQRCDAVWHYLDFYGNVMTEPLAFDNQILKANEADSQRATMITKGYMNCKVQYNDATRQLFTNSRIVLGTSVYKITGYSDFIQEFTTEQDSVNLLEFTVRYEEPNDAIDDMVNRVAGGKTFKWEILLASDTPTIRIGEQTQLIPTSIRTAEEYTSVVESTEEHPISYIWTSSDESVATVDSDGNVTGIAEGNAVITCSLEQNTEKTAEFTITVAGSATEPHVSFITTVPEKLKMFETAAIAARFFENGQPVEDAEITWTFSGANEKFYSYTATDVYDCIDGPYNVDPDDDEYTTAAARYGIQIKCWGGSVEPLTITASYNGYEASVQIELEGI